LVLIKKGAANVANFYNSNSLIIYFYLHPATQLNEEYDNNKHYQQQFSPHPSSNAQNIDGVDRTP